MRSAGLLAALVLMLTPGWAFAQEAAEPEVVGPEPLPVYTLPRPADLVFADDIAGSAIRRIRESSDPTIDEYRLLALALERALVLSPGDLHFARRAAEAWRIAEDHARALEATRRVLRMDPSDTVSQLRLLSDGIRSRQTVEERIGAYDRILGPAGESLDASVRSRLAVDAALLLRENGDERGFLRRIAQAMQLDSTNKDAAVLAWQHAQPRLTDPVERVEMIARMILADPLDAGAHAELAQELLAAGAFSQAQRFLDRVIDIRRLTGTRVGDLTQIDRLVTDWALMGGEPVLEGFAHAEEVERFRIAQVNRAVEQGLIEESERQEFRPNPPTERVRLAITTALDLEDAAREAAMRIVHLCDEAERAVRDEGFADGVAQQAIDTEVVALRSEALWARLWAGYDLEGAEQILEELRSGFGEAPAMSEAAAARAEGWLALRRGDYEGAEAALGKAAEGDTRARMGLGLSLELSGKPLDAARQYAAVIREQPGTLLGMWARTRAERAIEQPIRQTQAAAALDAFAANLPRVIDRMTSDPMSYIDLDVRHVERNIDILGRMELAIRLRNSGELPVAVGEFAPMNTRVLLSPQLTLAGTPVHANMTPEVAHMATRLRLRPGETIETRYWVGQGEVGRIVSRNPTAAASVRWRAIQGFGVTPDGFARGAYGRDATSDLLSRPAPLNAPNSAGALAEVIESATGGELMQAIAVAGWLLNTGGGEEDPDALFAQRTRLAGALAARFPAFSPELQGWILLRTPASNVVPPMQVVEQAALDSGNAPALFAMLQSRALPPGHAIYAIAAQSEDTLLREYGATMKSIIESRQRQTQ